MPPHILFWNDSLNFCIDIISDLPFSCTPVGAGRCFFETIPQTGWM